MVSRENTVIAVCLLSGIVVAVLIDTVTELPFWVAMAALLGLGIVVPTSLNEYRRRAA